MAHPVFLVKRNKFGKFRFNLTAKNGKVILTSEGYEARSSCEKGVASVRRYSIGEPHYERKVAANGKHYFVLKSANGQVIGQSEQYASKASLEKGIRSVKVNAPVAEIRDSEW